MAWDAGGGLGGVLGRVAQVQGPWTDEEAARVTRAELTEELGVSTDRESLDDAVDLGVLERIPVREDQFLVPSPQEPALAAQLLAVGVPLSAILGLLKEIRVQAEHIADRFLQFTAEHLFARHLGHRLADGRGRGGSGRSGPASSPLAQQTVDAELARGMRVFALGGTSSSTCRRAARRMPLQEPTGDAAGEHNGGCTESGWRDACRRVHRRGR
ncbi:hypothetical protein HW130_10835 [Streptomyces sp. PKU-EA00015]|uniref:hypothetical protein n=1 Tax=Streptomyces sp. PKU-EA00015 TaxID=2748326 RepID=UPI0015A3AABA|nr:hypothetical protein [Streptomyces sp. PKU-EA00015]